MELRRVQPARFLAGSHIPLDDHSQQVGRDQELPIGRVSHAIDRSGVARQVHLGFAVGQRPEPDLVVVAACRNLGSVRTDGDRTDPAMMGDDCAHRLGSIGRRWPGDQITVGATREKSLTVLCHRQGENRAIVGGESHGLGLGGVGMQIPALDRVVSTSGEHESPGRIEPAGDQRLAVL